MILNLIRDAAIGRRVRQSAAGILTQARFAGYASVGVFDWQTDLGDFEIIVRKKS